MKIITVAKDQAVLSAWGHYAIPESVMILAAPIAFCAGEEVNIDATKGPGGTCLWMTDGSQLLAYTKNGILPGVNTIRVWSVPEEGTVIPPDLEYVEIHASYRTRDERVLTAQTNVPVAIPTEMRFVFPKEPRTDDSGELVDEGAYNDFYDTWFDRDDRMGFKNRFAPEGELVVYWQTRDGRLIRYETLTEESRGTLYLNAPFSVSLTTMTFIMAENTESRTITRYNQAIAHDEDGNAIMPEGEEIELENSSNLMYATYTIKNSRGNVLANLRAETYFGTNPVVSWGFYKMPTTYVGDETVTLNINDHSKIVFKDDKVKFGQGNWNGCHYSIWFRYKTIGGWWENEPETYAKFADGRTGNISQYCYYTARTDGQGTTSVQKVSNKTYYTCSGGTITWSNPPEE
jgi:hypothetical protein